MANPTTNFGWVMPTATDLVTDLPADFNVFGQAVDTSMAQLKGGTTGQILSKTSATDMAFTWITNDVGDITAVTAGTGISGGGTSGAVTITNSMATAITTAGDLIKGTGSGTFDRLGIGSTGQVLTVASGAPSWATPAVASSGLTFISRTSFSNVASQAIDNCFTSSYKSYLVIIEKFYAVTGTDDGKLQLRTGGASGSTTASGYFGSSMANVNTGATFANEGSNNAAYWAIANTPGTSSTWISASLTFTNVGNTSETPRWSGTGMTGNGNNETFLFGGTNGTANTYTGLIFSSISTNVSGVISIYGLAAA